MNYMKNIALVSFLIAGLLAAKKSDYAKVLSSDIQNTIIEFTFNKYTVTICHRSHFYP